MHWARKAAEGVRGPVTADDPAGCPCAQAVPRGYHPGAASEILAPFLIICMILGKFFSFFGHQFPHLQIELLAFVAQGFVKLQ